MKLFLSLLVAGVVWIQGGTLGVSDDEAYYWVLSQKLDWGYAYHPPLVAWWLAGARAFASLFTSDPIGASAWVVRGASAALNGLWIWTFLSWIGRAAPQERIRSAFFVFIGFGALFAMSWMMVPDLTLILGVLIAFRACWDLCFSVRPKKLSEFELMFGLLVALLSKISAVLFFPSVLLLLVLHLWRKDRGRLVRATVLLLLAGVLGALPTLIWNAQNDWVSLSYQLSERHAGSVSFLRLFRSWALQLALAGPMVFYLGQLLIRKKDSETWMFLIWLAPTAVVFLLQPFFSDFKPHWALLIWLFPVLHGALQAARRSSVSGVMRIHLIHGLILIVAFWSALRTPWVTAMSTKNEETAALLDVTNDLHGWSLLSQWAEKNLSPVEQAYPWVGARYQTASQAAFALKDPTRVTLLPQHRRDRLEWPNLSISESVPGSVWPRLLKPAFFVADLRYSAAPEFQNANCQSYPPLEARRGERFAKRIIIWKCVPL